MDKRGRMIGEFVLIVVGVLVALMVEAGLESRKDDSLRDEYLSRIRMDLHSTGNIRLLDDIDLRTSRAVYYN